jgi:DNA-directed RNA polymerase subunit RPC12/RpoP
MEDNNLPFLFYWRYSTDGTVETNWPGSTRSKEEIVATPELLDIDKLIEESTGIYRIFWETFKRNHPERCIIRDEPKVVIPPAKAKTPAKLSCKRCKHEWIPRTKQPPVQCPKCHSPYWNRERKK